MSKSAALVEGTSIPKNRMAEMMAHSKALLGEDTNTDTPGDQLIEEPEIDHRTIARNLHNARPNLLDDISKKITRRRRAEGVQGTSPTPGQDDLGLATMPPTTSMVTNPGTLGGEDPEDELIGDPEDEHHPNETRRHDVDQLFAEGDGEGDEDDDDNGDEDGKGKDKEKGKNGDGDEDDDDNGKDESVEVICGKCGYEEEYNLNEDDMASNPPPMKDGQLDTTCPMCGGDMDFSLIGATDQEKVGDPNPFTDPRGNDGGGGEAPVESIHLARSLMHRLGEGENIEKIVDDVISSDFIDKNFRFKQESAEPFFEQAVREWYDNDLTDGEREIVLAEASAYSRAFDKGDKYSKRNMLGKTAGSNLSQKKGVTVSWDQQRAHDQNVQGKSYSDLHPVQQRAVKQSVRQTVAMSGEPDKSVGKRGTSSGYGAYDKLHGRLSKVGFSTTKDTMGAIKGGRNVDPGVNAGHIAHDKLDKHLSNRANGWKDDYSSHRGSGVPIGQHTFSQAKYDHPEHGTIQLYKPTGSGSSRYSTPNLGDKGTTPHIYHKPVGGRGKYMPIDHPNAQALMKKIGVQD